MNSSSLTPAVTWLPSLYKKSSSGALQVWKIGVRASTIVTTYGRVNGALQQTTDTIQSGKNTGKANSTTPEQQAFSEARAKHEKQRKKGYVLTTQAAENGAVDEVVTGGIAPMLAHKFSDYGHKIKFPCYIDPKLDGIRCIAMIAEGECTLWTRTRKPITGVPHIQREMERLFPAGQHMWDGELYIHKSEDFEQIVSYVRQKDPKPGHENVEYWIYDKPGPGSYKQRWIDKTGLVLGSGGPVHAVCTQLAESAAHIITIFEELLALGYEGAMVKQATGLYAEGKRSQDLLKLKEFVDDEFEIIGCEEGRGKLQGHVAAFICKAKNGAEFKAKMRGETAMLRRYWLDPLLYTGQLLTVKFQNLTGASGVPRFPVGIRLRDPQNPI